MKPGRRALLGFMLLGPLAANGEMLADASLLEAMAAADWPVVDGRDLAERSQQAIAGALPFDAELRLDAAHVLVLAEDDAAARVLARVVEARFPGTTAVAVAGGAPTLRGVRRAAAAAFVDGMPRNFTIPSDTCQPGEPLHIFTDGEESNR
jgi:hypothetical protein